MTFKEAMDKAQKELGFKPYIASLQYKEWMAKSSELYARSKWDEACQAQINSCLENLRDQDSLSYGDVASASKPEFKP